MSMRSSSCARAARRSAALPRREREVLALLAWSDLSYGEIAEALGLPIGTVRSRLARARTRLGDAFPDLNGATRPAEEAL